MNGLDVFIGHMLEIYCCRISEVFSDENAREHYLMELRAHQQQQPVIWEKMVGGGGKHVAQLWCNSDTFVRDFNKTS